MDARQTDWSDLPADVLVEIFSYLPPEQLLDLINDPLNKQTAPIFKRNDLWLENYSRHVPRQLTASLDESKAVIFDWHQAHLAPPSISVTLEKIDFITRLNLAAKNNDIVELMQIFKDHKENAAFDPMHLAPELITSFLLRIDFHWFSFSFLQIARRNGYQGFLDACYKEFADCVTTYCQTDPHRLRLSLTYWAIHCRQPIDVILEHIHNLSTLDNSGESRYFEYQKTVDLGLQPIHMAAQAGYIELLKELLKSDPSLLNVVFSSGFLNDQSPLSHAIRANETEAAFMLIQYGASLIRHDIYSETVLDIAAANGMKYLASILLKLDPNFLEQPKKGEHDDGQKPLAFALRNYQTNMALFLLEAGADIHYRFCSYKHSAKISAVEFAAQLGHIDVLRKMKLIDPSCLKNTSLIVYAASHNQIETVSYLIEEGAEVNVGNDQWSNPLINAVHYERFPLAVLLLKHGATRCPLPTTDQHHHQYPLSNPFAFRGSPNPGFNLPWEPDEYIRSSMAFKQLWNLLDYIEAHAAPDYKRPVNRHTLFHRARNVHDELAAAQSLRDLLYNNLPSASLDRDTQTLISKDHQLREFYTWYKEYCQTYPAPTMIKRQ